MLGVLTTILGLIPGLSNLVQFFIGKYYDSKVQIYMARTGATKEVAVAAIGAVVGEEQAATARLSTIAGSKVLSFILLAFAVPLAIYWNKIILYDILWCAGQCSTDPLRGEIATWASTVTWCLFGSPTVLAATHLGLNALRK